MFKHPPYRDNDIADVFDMTWCVEHDRFGKIEAQWPGHTGDQREQGRLHPPVRAVALQGGHREAVSCLTSITSSAAAILLPMTHKEFLSSLIS